MDEETLPVLADLMADDPDARVQAAAAETLGETRENSAAVQALLTALDDPNVEVVLVALDALEFVGDASHIPDLTPFLLHENPEVREATVDTIEWLDE